MGHVPVWALGILWFEVVALWGVVWGLAYLVCRLLLWYEQVWCTRRRR